MQDSLEESAYHKTTRWVPNTISPPPVNNSPKLSRRALKKQKRKSYSKPTRVVLFCGKFVFNVFIMIFISAALFVAYSAYTQTMQFVPLRTGSMSPLIAAGDVAVLSRVPAVSLKAGDIIAFIPPGLDANNRYVHRITKVARYDPQPIVYTKGDANPVEDSWSPIRLNQKLVWKYDFTIRAVGYGVFFLKTAAVRMSLLLIGALCILVPILKRVWRKNPKEQQSA